MTTLKSNAAYLEDARVHLRNKKFDIALDDLGKVNLSMLTDYQLRLFWSHSVAVFTGLENWEDARSALDMYEEIVGKNFYYHFLCAELYLAQSNVSKAVEHARENLRLSESGFDQARLYLAKLLNRHAKMQLNGSVVNGKSRLLDEAIGLVQEVLNKNLHLVKVDRGKYFYAVHILTSSYETYQKIDELILFLEDVYLATSDFESLKKLVELLSNTGNASDYEFYRKILFENKGNRQRVSTNG
jgi:tetratricopeptide (TPR) repeat protein